MATQHFTVSKAHEIAHEHAGACGNGKGEYTDREGYTYYVRLPTSIPADIIKAIEWLAEEGYGCPDNLVATIEVRDPAGELWGAAGVSTTGEPVLFPWYPDLSR